MLVIGIDPSLTGTGIVVLNDGKMVKALTTRNSPELDTVERVLTIKRQIDVEISNYNFPILTVIEGFSYGSKGRALFDIAYLGWRIREYLEWIKNAHLNPWLEVPPSQLKLFATGKGNSAKEVILQQVYKRWGVEFSDNNQADAFVLAKIGEAYLGATDGLTDFQLDVIANLKGEKPKKKSKAGRCDK